MMHNQKITSQQSSVPQLRIEPCTCTEYGLTDTVAVQYMCEQTMSILYS